MQSLLTMRWAGRPQCRSKAKLLANCEDCAYLLSLPAFPWPPVCHRSTGALRPQCRPKANWDGCATSGPLLTSSSMGSGAPANSGLAPPTSDPCTLTDRRQARLAAIGQAARIGCWTGPGWSLARLVPSRPGHVRLEPSISNLKTPDLLPARAAVPNRLCL